MPTPCQHMKMHTTRRPPPKAWCWHVVWIKMCWHGVAMPQPVILLVRPRYSANRYQETPCFLQGYPGFLGFVYMLFLFLLNFEGAFTQILSFWAFQTLGFLWIKTHCNVWEEYIPSTVCLYIYIYL